MSKHLTIDEIQLIISKTPKSLDSNRFLHFENCSQCRTIYNRQILANSILAELKPRTAPEIISQKVIQSVERIAVQGIPKKKTDWVFLLAVVTLFAIGSWLLFSGKIAQYLPQNVTEIVSEQKQVVEENKYLDTVKDMLPSVNIDFKLPDLNQYSFFILMGLIAILFYYFLDRKLNQIYRIRKT
ncbi:MAG: hypothetical protein H6627_09750 [Calditrichae bacterium]|nr:hypothetical protein [Calditrichota bacterium]MCB9058839.1 hypothetical protein [Calditrichia bacterium]